MRKLVLLGTINPGFLNLGKTCYVYGSFQSRYLSLGISKDGLRLVIPYRLRGNHLLINNFLKEKKTWIEKQLKRVREIKTHKTNLPQYLIENGKKIEGKELQQHAKIMITKRAKELAAFGNFRFNHIYIRDQRTRWGSCSSKKNLSFNWRLVLLPKNVSDYIIYHELVHLNHPNHSKVFWQELSKYCSEGKNYKKYLNQYRLD
ncbi:MAG: M48 family metallopeptidase [Candidatus Berkelbacteria bacterium]|nr:M48 family metallopeptidase [Candidatus Berkelbacteria bacterium]